MESKWSKEPYKILLGTASGEIEEKKSRFIANLKAVETQEEASSFIEEIKKKYWDARHNCFAYVIGSKAEITRCSDDGEPSQTAGKPMLEVLLGEEIRNVVVVVTRYFGGTLLGTGGLVRAYTAAVKEGLLNSQSAMKRYGSQLRIETDYNGIGKLQYIMGKKTIEIKDSEYTEVVKIRVIVPIEEKELLLKEIVEATNGKAKIEEETCFYYVDKSEKNTTKGESCDGKDSRINGDSRIT